jgi:hypothetical protein
VVVKAMILNGLGFVSAPLYLFEQFFVGKATEHLLGEGLEAEHFNDDRLGQGLDQLYQAGVSDLFVGLALQARERFEVECRSGHLDATSFAVDGNYATVPEALVPGAPVPYSGDPWLFTRSPTRLEAVCDESGVLGGRGYPGVSRVG